MRASRRGVTRLRLLRPKNLRTRRSDAGGRRPRLERTCVQSTSGSRAGRRTPRSNGEAGWRPSCGSCPAVLTVDAQTRQGSGLGPDARRHRSRAQRARKNVTEHLTTVLLEDGAREGSARTRMHRGKLEGMMRLLGRGDQRVARGITAKTARRDRGRRPPRRAVPRDRSHPLREGGGLADAPHPHIATLRRLGYQVAG